MQYQADSIRDPVDLFVLSESGAEPMFDPVLQDFMLESYRDAKDRLANSPMVELVSLGRTVPWLYRITLRTRGLGRSPSGAIEPVDHHTIAFRMLPDYLRSVNRFATLAYIAPRQPAPFHPNIEPRTGAICLQVFPGESVCEVVQSLHDLLRWRIRELRENHAFNHDACRYGRQHVTSSLDDRPLMGSSHRLEIVTSEESS